MNADRTKSLEFWFDFASPYAYFASLWIDELAAKHRLSVHWRPFLLGAVFQATGMQPLIKGSLRGNYAIRDWNRLARKMNVPFVLSEAHPFSPVAAARAFLWLEQIAPELSVPFARSIFQASFAKGADLRDGTALLDLGESAGVDRSALAAALTRSDLKQRFRAQTEEALLRGVFGSPFFFADDEPFWGADRLPMLDEWLVRGGW